MAFDDAYYPEEEAYRDEHLENAKEQVLKLITGHKVVTDRELKVRLERNFFPWVTGAALAVLLNKDVLKKVGYAGRPTISLKGTESFFCLQETKYDEIIDLIRDKKRVSLDVINVLTGQAPASAHAEDLFYDAFVSLNFKIHGRNVKEFQGRKSYGKTGKEAPDVDFVIERDGLTYGVDIKNWIRYEAETRLEVEDKVATALQLGTIPFIAARYFDQDTFYTKIHTKSTKYGIAYRYVTLLLPPTMQSLAEKAEALLGYPTLAVDALPEYKIKWIEKLHDDRVKMREKG